MAVREILRYPSPQLRQVCEPAVPGSPELGRVVADLLETLRSLPGCVGIAAPQIGEMMRVVIVDASRGRKPVPNQGCMVLVNPVLESTTGTGIFREGCLSIPDYTANVPRATEVRYQTVDENGTLRAVTAQGFEAVVIQHEADHLDGILFIDRVVCAKTDLFRRKSYL
jgi:peptide deformylase